MILLPRSTQGSRRRRLAVDLRPGGSSVLTLPAPLLLDAGSPGEPVLPSLSHLTTSPSLFSSSLCPAMPAPVVVSTQRRACAGIRRGSLLLATATPGTPHGVR
jgi:hypothetical protein